MFIAIALHVLAAVIWVGGMFFAYVCLRPAATQLLETPPRLALWIHTFQHFFFWIWIAILILPATGQFMIGYLGGMAAMRTYIHIMMMLGYIMIALYLYLYFVPFSRLKKAVSNSDWPQGGKQLRRIRQIVAINLSLGLIVIVVATAGRWVSI